MGWDSTRLDKGLFQGKWVFANVIILDIGLSFNYVINTVGGGEFTP
jgi:hypothetical protein